MDPAPRERRYKTNDPTTEKLGEILVHNPAMLVVRDELAGWWRSLEKDGRQGDREFYLESWNGAGSYTYDRIARGTIHIPRLCISVVGGTQPAKLAKYIADALAGGWDDDGLIQRFQAAVYPDPSGKHEYIDRTPDERAYQRAFCVFQCIDQLTPDELGAEVEGDLAHLHFCPDDAQLLFRLWLEELEGRLRSGEIGSPAFESHLAKYRKLMPSLALTFELIEWADEDEVSDPVPYLPPTRYVGLDSTARAIDFCEFLEAHARRIYAGAINPALQAAHALATKIKSGKIQHGDTIRSVYRREWSLLRAPEIVRAGLSVLEDHCWLRLTHMSTGGRSRKVIQLHPDFRK